MDTTSSTNTNLFWGGGSYQEANRVKTVKGKRRKIQMEKRHLAACRQQKVEKEKLRKMHRAKRLLAAERQEEQESMNSNKKVFIEDAAAKGMLGNYFLLWFLLLLGALKWVFGI
jgi:hypothetical protein